MRSARGFTLIEIAFALAIIAGVITACGLALGGAVHAQQIARFRLYAAVKAIEMTDISAESDHQFLRQAYEGEKLGQSPFTWNQTDIERALLGGWYGTLVLPDDIATRIDSEGDEIAHLLARGGKLFYASPRPPMAADGEGGTYYTNGWTREDMRLPPETQKLVIGVVGDAQQDALLCHPCLGWPYLSYYPSPPDVLVAEATGIVQWPERDAWDRQAIAWGWPAVTEMHDVCAASRPAKGDLAATLDYIAKCQRLIAACGVATHTTAGGPVPDPPAALPAGTWSAGDPDVFPPPWRVLAMRWLADAATLRTSNLLPMPTPAEATYAQDVHEAALQWAHRYARSDPYDWGANRVVQDICALDYPLLQFDLFNAPATVDDGGGSLDSCWKVAPGRTVTNHAQARGYDGLTRLIADNFAEVGNSWGDCAHFTLTDRFAAEERTRQLVFWAVDWQSYEDFETAPTAAFDARQHNLDSRGAYVRHQDMLANPERDIVWQDATHAVAGFRPTPGGQMGDMDRFPLMTVGAFGADRNGNGVFDRGPLPRTVRLRASSVARYNIYDKRIFTSLRN